MSLPELLERAEDLPDEKVGLAGGTNNRNITILGNFLDFAANRGAKPAEALRMTALRKKKTEDERTARLAFTDADVGKLAQHPIWTGCLSATRRNKPGNMIFKDALYWGPILAAASGARREEIMGLAVADIILDAPVPHILIRPNCVRRLKNASSKPAVPIHSRVLDLGFSDYVKEMSVESDRDLFPELCPGSSAETYGNVFFKPWKSALDQQLGEEAGRKTFHSFRHRVITFLRHKPGVDKAAVKDLVGHHHEDVTDSIYRDPAKILGSKILSKLFQLFSDTFHQEPVMGYLGVM